MTVPGVGNEPVSGIPLKETKSGMAFLGVIPFLILRLSKQQGNEQDSLQRNQIGDSRDHSISHSLEPATETNQTRISNVEFPACTQYCHDHS